MRNAAGRVATTSPNAQRIATNPIPIFLIIEPSRLLHDGRGRPESTRSRDGSASLERPDRAHLDRAAARARAAGRPRERGVEVGYVDHVKAAELLLGLGVGTVDHLGPAVDDSH